jgi:peptide/nickel transport system substrate-binding protein
MVSRRISRRSFLSKGAATGGIVALGVGAGSALTSGLSGVSDASGSTSAADAKSSPGVSRAKPVRGGSAIVGTWAEVDGFYPASNHWDVDGYLYANTVYDPLTAVAIDGSIQPYLAQSVVPNATYTQWTVTLRSGITFNDGSPLTAQVVKNNFDALRASALTGTALNAVTGTTVTGPLTLVYNCNVPYVAFPAALSTQVGYVVGQAMLDAVAKSPNSPPPVIGTGPFIYSQWQPNDHFTATRNPHYWRSGYPYLDSITYKPIPDTSQREAALRSGDVDLIISNDPNTVNHFKGSSAYQVFDSLQVKTGEPDMDFVMLNCAVAPTNDLRVRQALAMGLNQKVIQKLFGGGLAQSTNGIFPPGSPYYSKNTGYPAYNPTAAKKLVAAYKKEHGSLAFQLVTIPDPRLAKVVQVLQQMWQQIGCNVSIKSIEQATLISNAITGNYQAVTFEQYSAPDPGINYVWWSTTTVSPVNSIGLNFARNSDATVQQALTTGRSTTSASARINAYKTVNKQLAKDLPYLWLGQTVWSEVGDARIQNFANPTLPNGKRQIQFDNGIFVPTQIWMKS